MRRAGLGAGVVCRFVASRRGTRLAVLFVSLPGYYSCIPVIIDYLIDLESYPAFGSPHHWAILSDTELRRRKDTARVDIGRHDDSDEVAAKY
jgi:hypothetical protein